MSHKKLLYHITDFENFESILKNGTLLANQIIKEKGYKYESIAHRTLQKRRSTKVVPLSPYGTLHDYVPFYFAPRPPMLYVIYKGQVEGYEKDQSQIVYLVTRTDIVHRAGLDYVFTDGHAIMNFTIFLNDLKKLDQIDWEVMEDKYWADHEEDPDHTRRRQAEFLVHKSVPIDIFLGFAVKNRKMENKVSRAIEKYNYDKPVAIRRWYY